MAKADVAKLKAEKNITPGLAVVLVGNDPASEVYVRNKGEADARKSAYAPYEFKPTRGFDHGSGAAFHYRIAEFKFRAVHGILVQLPLPKHINEEAIINTLSPTKDVDGFHRFNAGKLATGQDGLVPCTPFGCVMLLKDTLGNLSGKHAVVIGRSNIVGKPVAQLLIKENCTVTIAHSKTENIRDVVKLADIVIAAVGKPEMVKGEWLKQGAVVIDVGINRITLSDGKTKLVGDVDFEDCQEHCASAITPVPGGVGPMTIASPAGQYAEGCCQPK